ncbi:unnamed protein product [Adineta steineri]|uniref:Methyltransferase domain-containing protein n=1 Tax=Adineta steineri TaxID=433720 RepID=A0A818YLS4_9BILA|nr:unnamed protein product [Adineta steineri]CAF1410495.1 unnamed protein product [Adineta steineri]CAF3746287.1 unnamed protein product [Adineta steineri]CAF3757207.1 unnamed protein product [Adineta steineri]
MSLPSNDLGQEIFFEIHNNLSRQGPGSIQSTFRALKTINSNETRLNILDIGCGPGMITVELAKLGHSITAIDKHQPFIEILSTQAKEQQVSHHIVVLHGDMFCLEKFVEPHMFDVIWSEGSIYIIGFGRGLTEWKIFLKEDGYLVCSEITWLTTNLPAEAHAFWMKNYPEMRTQDENFEIIKECGYELIDSFVLDEKEWWQEYYGPMETKIRQLKIKYQGHTKEENILDEQQYEIDLYKKYSESYGYVFYIMKNITNPS